jgi:hypothetical protein
MCERTGCSKTHAFQTFVLNSPVYSCSQFEISWFPFFVEPTFRTDLDYGTFYRISSVSIGYLELDGQISTSNPMNLMNQRQENHKCQHDDQDTNNKLQWFTESALYAIKHWLIRAWSKDWSQLVSKKMTTLMISQTEDLSTIYLRRVLCTYLECGAFTPLLFLN